MNQTGVALAYCRFTMPETPPNSLLAAKDLKMTYDLQTVLKGTSLTICENDRVGLVGHNGSGKSTFLRILSGQLAPDSGSVIPRNGLRLGYLPQELELNHEHTVEESIRSGAREVLGLIKEFETLPADSSRHESIEQQILALDGWHLDQRIRTAMTHLRVPEKGRAVSDLSGGEQRRVALCQALIARPELLILDEPTNHLDNESILWMVKFLEKYPGALLLVTHDRYFLDRVTNRIVELANGLFYPYKGNYTRYLEASAQRRTSEAIAEKRRQIFLRRELEWVRRGPKARTTKAKSRIDRFEAVAAQTAVETEETVNLLIPPPPAMGNRIVDLVNVGHALGGRTLFQNLHFNFHAGMKIGIVGCNGAGKTTLLKVIMGQLAPNSGTVKIGQLIRFNYVDQTRLQLNPEHRLIEAVGDGSEFVIFGQKSLSLRGYLKQFLFSEDRIDTKIKLLSGGERSRLLLAVILKQGGNFLLLDEPTNDLDLNTLRVLEEALAAFPGVIVAVSHDRYFLNRICTGILAFEAESQVTYSVGNYDYYLEKRQRLEKPADEPKPSPPNSFCKPTPSKEKRRKLSWKESRELEGMEARIMEAEQEIERLEAIFSSPGFHKEHGDRTKELNQQLEAARKRTASLYARWEELEIIPK